MALTLQHNHGMCSRPAPAGLAPEYPAPEGLAPESFVLKGDVVHSLGPNELEMLEDAYLVCQGGVSAGVFSTLPAEYQTLPLLDHSGHLIIPGLIDLHTHAPQYGFRAQGMDLELLDWLNQHTFPAEARFADTDYAKIAYAEFVHSLKIGATSRALIFATIHTEASLALMDLCETSGLNCYVGKVNMDRNAIPELEEAGPSTSLAETESWLSATLARNYQRTRPILTPRFAPSCSDELLAGLGQLQKLGALPVQSHLSENQAEIDWVAELFPDSRCYADAYLQNGLFGGTSTATVMAHCVHSAGLEAELLRDQGVWVAHCPESNTCLSSGIAPARKFLDLGIKLGLGTDVAGGYSLSMLHTIAEAIKVSKLRWRLIDAGDSPLKLAEAFYLATRGGGSFFGKVGSFDAGFEFDAVVFDEYLGAAEADIGLMGRLERLVYLSDQHKVIAKYVAGKIIDISK